MWRSMLDWRNLRSMDDWPLEARKCVRGQGPTSESSRTRCQNKWKSQMEPGILGFWEVLETIVSKWVAFVDFRAPGSVACVMYTLGLGCSG